MTVAPRVLPAPERVAQIIDLAELGWVKKDIRKKVFEDVEQQFSGVATKLVGLVLEDLIQDPDEEEVRLVARVFHTDIDEIAVARALLGDRDVWENLTHYERRAVLLRVWDRREQERAENAEDLAGLNPVHWDSGAYYVAPNPVTPEWLRILAEAAGVEPKRLVEMAKDTALASVL